MMRIPCPYCGVRDETEFTCGGETGIARPPESVSDREWAEYLFFRTNPKGVCHERWLHARGCRRWFNLARDNVTHAILAAYRMDEPPPTIEDTVRVP